MITDTLLIMYIIPKIQRYKMKLDGSENQIVGDPDIAELERIN